MFLKAKLKFKDKLEHEFGNKNIKLAFLMMKTLTGREPKHSLSTSTDTELFTDKLNSFFMRFDTQDFTDECVNKLKALLLVTSIFFLYIITFGLFNTLLLDTKASEVCRCST